MKTKLVVIASSIILFAGCGPNWQNVLDTDAGVSDAGQRTVTADGGNGIVINVVVENNVNVAVSSSSQSGSNSSTDAGTDAGVSCTKTCSKHDQKCDRE